MIELHVGIGGKELMMRFFCATIALILSLAAVSGEAQEHRQGVRIVTRTRLQVLFADLERQWLEAVQQQKQAPLNSLLSDDFQVWTPTPPGEPIPREDWWKKAVARKLQSFELHQLAVRGVSPEISLASFVLTERLGDAGKTRTEEHFVVDVWVKTGDSWRCTDRYWWDVGSVAVAGTPKPDVKPTGKE
jgi:hypothetical protein